MPDNRWRDEQSDDWDAPDNDDRYDDEDDADSEYDDDAFDDDAPELVDCPECGQPVYEDAEGLTRATEAMLDGRAPDRVSQLTAALDEG